MANIITINIDGTDYQIKDTVARNTNNNLQTKISNEITNRKNAVYDEMDRARVAENSKINKPTDSPYGRAGQILRTNGDETTSWIDPGLPTEDQISTAINAWLDAHPDATTTVQDGAITLTKMIPGVRSVLINPDLNEGTDYQKLQKAIDDAIDNKYATIIISRKYDITGNQLKINKGLYEPETGFRKKLTFIGVNSGEIYKSDSGYIFTGDTIPEVTTQFSGGDIQCINMAFAGNDHQVTGSDMERLCSVFDCHKLIRITTFGCSFTYVCAAFDGFECIDGTNNMQQVVNYGDLCTFSHAYYRLGATWVVSSDGCTIERCNYAYVNTGVGTITCLHIKDCTIEGNDMGGIYIVDPPESSAPGLTNIVVNGCYFETNGTYDSNLNNITTDIQLNCRYTYNVTITNNHFAPHPYGHCIDLLIRHTKYCIENNDCMSTASNAYLIYANVDTVALGNQKIYVSNNLTTGITLTNQPTILIDNSINRFTQYAEGLTANGLNKNINNLPFSNSMIIHIVPEDFAEGLPSGETEGELIHMPDSSSNIIQIFVAKVSKEIWIRARITGLGFTAWKPINGCFTFEKAHVKHGDVIDFPVPITSRSAVTVFQQFSSSARASMIFPSSIVSSGATSFTLRIYDPTTGLPSELDDFTIIVMVSQVH